MPTLKQLQVPHKIVLGLQSDATPTGGNNSMAVDGYFFTKEHVGWMGVEHRSTHMTKPPIKTCTLFIMSFPNVWKRASVTKYLDTCAAVQEYVARWMNSNVLYCRERERI